MNEAHYLFDLPTLRNIGRSLRQEIHTTPPADTEDAVDSCLIRAAGLALRGEHEDEICDYIICCREQMRIVTHDGAIAETVRSLLGHVERVRTRAD